MRKDIRKPDPVQAGTADLQELSRFNALAEEWWKPDGKFKVIHRFNKTRVELLSDRLPRLMSRAPDGAVPLAGLRVLDVGCAAGLVTEPIARLGAEVTGIDAVERNIAVASRHAAASGVKINYRHALPEDYAAQTEKFDIVLSLEVVEHVGDLPVFLGALASLVKLDGILVIGTLNRTIRSYLKAIVGAEYLLRWLPRGTHTWRKFVTPEELERALRPYGFTVEEICGVALNPMKQQWQISSDTSATYLEFFRKA